MAGFCSRIFDRMTYAEKDHLVGLLDEHKRSTTAAKEHVAALKQNRAPAEAFRLVAQSETAGKRVGEFCKEIATRSDPGKIEVSRR